MAEQYTKKQFIDFNIRQRSTQIFDAANRALTQKEKYDILSKIEKFNFKLLSFWNTGLS